MSHVLKEPLRHPELTQRLTIIELCKVVVFIHGKDL